MNEVNQHCDIFKLHPSLAESTFSIADLDLCKVLLQNDARFSWVVLVPCVCDIKEFYELSSDNQHLLMDEMAKVSKILQTYTKADKINIAAFGNMTPQLHIHIIARFKTDSFWPNSVIGVGGQVPYTEIEREQIIKDFNTVLLER